MVLANARMLGMNERQLLRHVYWPSALTWMFSSLHTSVGFALVGAVVGEYLGSSAGLGYKIHEAESVFDVTGVFAGMLILAVFVILIDAVVTLVENRLLVWRPGPSTTRAGLEHILAADIEDNSGGTPMERRTFLIGTGAAGRSPRASAPARLRAGRAREAEAHARRRRQAAALLPAADDRGAEGLLQGGGSRGRDQRFRRRRQVAAGADRRLGRRRHRRLRAHHPHAGQGPGRPRA